MDALSTGVGAYVDGSANHWFTAAMTNTESSSGLLVTTCGESRPTDWYLDQVRSGRRSGGAGGGGPSGVRPMTRGELQRAGVSDSALRKYFTRIEHGVYLHNKALLPEKTSGGYVRQRRISALALVRAHVLHNPDHVATGFAAGAGYGMRYFVQEEILEFLVSRGAQCSNPAPHLQFTRTRQLASFRKEAHVPDQAFAKLRCAAPPVALGHMLRTLEIPDDARDQRWKVPDLTSVRPHFSRSFIRSVQASDALHSPSPTSLRGLRRMSGASPRRWRRWFWARRMWGRSHLRRLCYVWWSRTLPRV